MRKRRFSNIANSIFLSGVFFLGCGTQSETPQHVLIDDVVSIETDSKDVGSIYGTVAHNYIEGSSLLKAPLENVKIGLWGRKDKSYIEKIDETSTFSEGNFSFKNIPSGSYELHLKCIGVYEEKDLVGDCSLRWDMVSLRGSEDSNSYYLTSPSTKDKTVSVFVEKQKAKDLGEILLEPEDSSNFIVYGKIYDWRGTPAKNGNVAVNSTTSRNDEIAKTRIRTLTTSEDGSFATYLPPGGIICLTMPIDKYNIENEPRIPFKENWGDGNNKYCVHNPGKVLIHADAQAEAP